MTSAQSRYIEHYHEQQRTQRVLSAAEAHAQRQADLNREFEALANEITTLDKITDRARGLEVKHRMIEISRELGE